MPAGEPLRLASSGLTGGRAAGWRVGETAPFTVAWSEEVGFGLQPSTVFPGMTELTQVERPGEGVPMFAVQHVVRHRLGMAHQLCHVCGRPTPRRDRWLFPLHSGGPVTLADGSVRYGGNVPPVHLECAKRAQRLCPHLKGAAAQPVAFPKDEGRLVPRTDVTPDMEAVARTLPPGLDVVLTCYRLHGEAFSRTVERLRQTALSRAG